jgi:hypothetical protein
LTNCNAAWYIYGVDKMDHLCAFFKIEASGFFMISQCRFVRNPKHIFEPGRIAGFLFLPLFVEIVADGWVAGLGRSTFS